MATALSSTPSPKGLTGFQFVDPTFDWEAATQTAQQLAWRAIERVNLVDAATRNVAAYSKGMRQRIRLAQALCHNPPVLGKLDEPLNGLNAGRAEMIVLFRSVAVDGCYVIISSQIS